MKIRLQKPLVYHKPIYATLSAYTLLLPLAFLFLLSTANAQNVSISYNAALAQPDGAFTVCGNAEQNTLRFSNGNLSTITGVTFTLHMPTGATYIAGSITNAVETNITDLSNPQFSMADLASADDRDISYRLSFNCAVINFQNAGGLTKEIVDIHYNGSISQTGLTPLNSYNVVAGALSIISVSNSAFAGNVGSSFLQNIVIRNGGLGCINSGFLKLDNAGGTFTFSNASVGSLVNDTLFFNAGNMPGGDGLWCNTEDLNITITTTINDCNNLSRNLVTGWGCGGSNCQISSSFSAGVTLLNSVPNLVAKFNFPDGDYVCNYPNYHIEMIVKNIGTGKATNIASWIGDGRNNLLAQDNQNWFVANEWEYSTNGGLSWQNVVATNTVVNTQNYVPAGSLGGFKASFPSVVINAGDSIIVRGVYHTAQFTDSTKCIAGDSKWGSFVYRLNYNNQCGVPINTGQLPLINAMTEQAVQYGYALSEIPAQVLPNSCATFTFSKFFAYASTIGTTNNGKRYAEIEWTIPSGLIFNNIPDNLKLISDYDGSIIAPLVGYPIVVGSKIITRIDYQTIGTTSYTIQLKLCNDCSQPLGGFASLLMNTRIVWNENCSPKQWVLLDCKSFNIGIGACGTIPCIAGGVNVDNTSSSIQRINFGIPDNNNDGLPDSTGSVDFNKVNVNRFAEGDTMNFNIKSVVNAGAAGSFIYAGMDITIDNSAWLNTTNAAVQIFDISTGNVYNGSLPIAIQSNNNINISFNSVVPLGFVFENGDSIRIVFNLRVRERGTGGQYQASPLVLVSSWGSNVANPSNTQKLSCTNLPYTYVIFYQSAMMQNVEANVFNGCNGDGISYMGMYIYTKEFGQSRGNAFPFEYRKATELDSATFTIDANYDFAGVVKIDYYKSLGADILNYTLPTSAYTVNGNVIKVSLVNIWNTLPGFTISTAANTIKLQVGIYPKCTAPANITSFGTMQAWLKSYRRTSVVAPAYGGFVNFSSTQLTGGVQVAVVNNAVYAKPSLSLQSPIATVLTNDTTAVWNIVLSNNNNNISPNTFLYIENTGTLHITQVKNITTNTIIYANVNGFYQLGNINGATSNNYQINATLHQCGIDSIKVFAGWGCVAYPTNINTYQCGVNVVLKTRANDANLDASFSAVSTGINNTFLMCEPFNVISTINSNQLGNLASETYKVVLPPNLSYINNSVETVFPSNAVFAPIAYNPSVIPAITGDTLLFMLNNLTGGIGLTGVEDLLHSQLKIKFQTKANCGFESGNILTAIYNGISVCGIPISTVVKTSTPINIQGAVPTTKYVVKLQSPASVTACQSAKTTTITVYNNDTTNAVINDSLRIEIPSGLSIVANSIVALNNAPSSLIPQVSGTVYKLPIKVGLQPGDSMKVSFQLQADGTSCGLKTLAASVVQSVALGCGAGFCYIQLVSGLEVNNQTDAICCPNLQVSKSANPLAVNIGNKTVYSIIVKNIGMGTATNVVINDLLPTAVNFESYTSTQGAYVANDWSIASISYGASDTLKITVTANVVGASINTAFLKSIGGIADANASNDTSSVTINISPKPNAGANKLIECGSSQTVDTLKGFPVGGVWSMIAGIPTSMTLGATNNGNAIINLPTTFTSGSWQFVYSINGDADTMTLTIGVNGNPTPAINMGNNPICRYGEVQLCPTVWGWSNFQWYKNGVAIAAPIGTASCITLDSTQVGSYTLAATNSSGCWTSQSLPIIITYNSSCILNVSSGGGGGLESQTLGDVISKRVYNNAINSIVTASEFNTTLFYNSGVVVNGVNDLTLNSLMPSSQPNIGIAYVSTPNDLLNFTNAVEVVAVDYVKNETRRAVAFGTKTLGDVYHHTKPICDRLKGAELLEVKTIVVNGFNLMAYKIKQKTNEVEYAINLTAGTATNRATISLQSHWFTNSYQQDEKLYNFQLWAISYDMVALMAKNIITKLQANGTVNATINADLPKAYISKGSRIGNKLKLSIYNSTNNTTGYFELKEKRNEQSSISIKKIPFTINSFDTSSIEIVVNDNYESNVYMYLNNKLSDLVYLADGAWALDYNKNSTTINKFTIENETVNINATNNADFNLFRNVEVVASSKDYVSIYKTMIGGGMEQDVTAYKALVFNANAIGASSVTVTLVKKSIAKWADQYSYTQVLNGNREYAINLSDFKSAKFADAVNANDIIAVNFSFVNSRGSLIVMTLNLSKVRFTNAFSNINATNSLTTIAVFPNPTVSSFTATFISEKEQPLSLKVIEIATGKVVKNQFIQAVNGSNQVFVALDNYLSNGNYIVNVDGDGIKYNPAQLMLQKR